MADSALLRIPVGFGMGAKGRAGRCPTLSPELSQPTEQGGLHWAASPLPRLAKDTELGPGGAGPVKPDTGQPSQEGRLVLAPVMGVREALPLHCRHSQTQPPQPPQPSSAAGRAGPASSPLAEAAVVEQER